MNMLKRIGLALAAPFIAVVVAVLATTAILMATGNDAGEFWDALLSIPLPRNQVNIINQASLIYISAVAAAIGFKMGLFNIGIEGQYTIAAYAAAAFAGAAFVPGLANVFLSLLIAVFVGAAWSGIAGILKTTRGVSEVISTIMLNAIAVILVGYLLDQYGVHEGNTVHTAYVPEESMMPGWAPFEPKDGEIWTLVLLALLVGFGYWFMLNRMVFGFDLRASGQSATAARASGVNANRMILFAMILSGAVAGLTWMPSLFGDAKSYGTAFQLGIGFLGLAVALLGRNQPLGIAFGALLFAFLTAQSNTLTLSSSIPPSIVQITQGIAVLAVVVAYEVVRRYRTRIEQSNVANELKSVTA